ncbi:MAG: hypothetical protein E6I12_14395 [Chloroflexi bacterium]|nr:MAG: hypothetical protein E6I12_14395 [Chloroflexota bacterium]TMF94777.1 MAG: hypothetical protein E6I05_02915 [Chloroflexota bacterium]
MNVGRERQLEQILDDDGEAERREQRRQDPGFQASLEHRQLEDVAKDDHHRQRGRERDESRHSGVLDDDEHDVRAEHRHVSMGEIDDPHHAEHDR